MLTWAIFFFVLIFCATFIFRRLHDNRFLFRFFKEHNTYTYGAKGTGKDLTFQHVIKHSRKPYLSNINYGGKFSHVLIKDLTVSPNTYESLIRGMVMPISKFSQWEGSDVYLSDCGIYLPSQADNLLTKVFPSLPIFFALSRQLYNMQFHINSQAFGRVWLKLREQADGFIKCVSSFKIGPWLFTRRVFYDRYQSADNDVRPLKRRGFFKRKNIDDVLAFESAHGLVRSALTFQTVRGVKFDTRYFHKLFFGFVYVPKKRKVFSKKLKIVGDPT